MREEGGVHTRGQPNPVRQKPYPKSRILASGGWATTAIVRAMSTPPSVAACPAGPGHRRGLLPVAGGLPGARLIDAGDLRTWLSYIASDELEGRATFTAPAWGWRPATSSRTCGSGALKPAGDGGTYLQTVRVRASSSTSRSSLTVRVGSETRTFKDGEGVTFPRNAGVSRTLTHRPCRVCRLRPRAPGADHSDFRGKDVEGRGSRLPGSRRPGSDRSAEVPAAAHRPQPLRDRPAAGSGDDRTRRAPPAHRSARPAAPAPNHGAGLHDGAAPRPVRCLRPSPCRDAGFEFLFSRAPTQYPDLKRRAEARETLPSFRLDQV